MSNLCNRLDIRLFFDAIHISIWPVRNITFCLNALLWCVQKDGLSIEASLGISQKYRYHYVSSVVFI